MSHAEAIVGIAKQTRAEQERRAETRRVRELECEITRLRGALSGLLACSGPRPAPHVSPGYNAYDEAVAVAETLLHARERK